MIKRFSTALISLILVCSTLISCTPPPNDNTEQEGQVTTSGTEGSDPYNNNEQTVPPITHPQPAPESVPSLMTHFTHFTTIDSHDHCPTKYDSSFSAYVEGYTGTYKDDSRLHPVLSKMRIKKALLLFKDLSITTRSGSAFYVSDSSLDINVFIDGQNALSSAASVTLNNNSGMNESTMDHNKCSTLRLMGVHGKSEDTLKLTGASDKSSVGGRVIVNSCTLDISDGRLTSYANILIEQGGRVIFPDGSVISLSDELGYGVYFSCDYENRKCRVYCTDEQKQLTLALTYSTGKSLELTGKSGEIVVDMPAAGTTLSMDSDFCAISYSPNGVTVSPSLKDGKYVYYIPSGSDLSSVDLELVVGKGFSAMIGSKRYTQSGTVTVALSKSGEASVTFFYPDGTRELRTLLFIASSANVLQINVDETRGSINAMHRDSSHNTSCYGELSYLASDSSESFTSYFSMKGRGNATWNDEKKGYALKLFEDASCENKNKINISGMGKTSSWVLIAGHRDRTLLRTALAFTLAQRLGLECAVDYVFVDLYMNGECLGLYMLVEKVQDGKDQIDVELATADDLNGSYILEFDNYDDTPQIILKNSWQRVTVSYPDDLSSYKAIEKLLNEADVALRDPSGYNRSTKKYWFDYIDIDSFAILWMVREYTMDYDADVNFRFYYDSSDGKFHAGPAWDFDNSMARSTGDYCDPELALLERAPRNPNSWLHLLMNFKPFTDKIVELYYDNMSLFATESNESIYALAGSLREQLSASIEMNFTVWNRQLAYNSWNMPKEKTYEGHYGILTDFLIKRNAFWRKYIPSLE